jgi:hypothetical protein
MHPNHNFISSEDVQGTKVYEAAGGYSPTIGIIGAVLGLIQVMQHLDDIKEVGSGIAVAFVATIYGVALANILFDLTPEPRVLDCFPGFTQFGTVIKEIPIDTRTLDSISEISHLDFLKIDVQGGELSVFRNGSARLSNAVAIQSEISFVTLYKNEPVFGEIDLALRAFGFIPHMFDKINKRMILPLHFDDNLFASMNQLLEADIVYVRDFTQPDKMSPEQLKHLALVAHHCYGSYDLAARCVHFLVARGAVAADAVGQYLAILGKQAG